MAVYNPNNGTPSNKPFSVQGKPEVGRQYYFDFGASNKWRMYQSTAEILSYLDTPIKRQGHPFFVVNTGGTLSNGVITGGVNELWWFKNGVADGDLVRIVSDVVIPNLQSVTDVGNLTSNAIQSTGMAKLDSSVDSAGFGHQAGESFFFNIADGQMGSSIRLRKETPSLSGAIIYSRVNVQPAVLAVEAVNLGQLESAIDDLNNIFEIIPFTASTGIINIDLTINNRNTLFPNVDIRAYNIEVINPTTKKETQIVGCVPKITEVSGVNTSLSVSYIAGDGYILLTNN